MRRNRFHHALLRRFLTLLLLLLPSIHSPAAVTGEPDVGLGYYFLSVELPEHVDTSYLKKKGQNLAQWLLLNNCTTAVHGPFRNKRQARRALREQKREQGDQVYFTGIYRL